ncbi:hypothetical protein C2G38_2077182, partial [Gigaspora rosea]
MVLNCVVLYVLVVLLRVILLSILRLSSMFPQIFSVVFRSLILFQLLQSILLLHIHLYFHSFH